MRCFGRPLTDDVICEETFGNGLFIYFPSVDGCSRFYCVVLALSSISVTFTVCLCTKNPRSIQFVLFFLDSKFVSE